MRQTVIPARSLASVLAQKGKRQKAPGLKLPDMPGPPSLSMIDERRLQRMCRPDIIRLMPPGTFVVHHANERPVGHMTDKGRKRHLHGLAADGAEFGLSDYQITWDMRLAPPGHTNHCYIEFKRPVRGSSNAIEVSANQLAYMYGQRALGVVAGWAQCWEHVVAILREAKAPFRAFDNGRDAPDWWAPLGSLPPLYADVPGTVRLPSGAVLNLGLR